MRRAVACRDVRTPMKNQTPKIIACILMLSLGCGLTVWSMRSEADPSQNLVYYYDLNTQQVFTAPAGNYAPIETESGLHEGQPAGARIYIYGCDEVTLHTSFAGMTLDEVRAAGGIPGWLEVFTPEAKASLQSEHPNPDAMLSGQLHRGFEDDRWYPSLSSQAAMIRQPARSACDGKATIANP